MEHACALALTLCSVQKDQGHSALLSAYCVCCCFQPTTTRRNPAPLLPFQLPLACATGCRHTSRFLLCYIHCLPLLLWPLAEWGSPVLAVMISFLVLGIEGISSYIEEPFHVRTLVKGRHLCVFHFEHVDLDFCTLGNRNMRDIAVAGRMYAPGRT